MALAAPTLVGLALHGIRYLLHWRVRTFSDKTGVAERRRQLIGLSARQARGAAICCCQRIFMAIDDLGCRELL
jgi:hypothetical protein